MINNVLSAEETKTKVLLLSKEILVIYYPYFKLFYLKLCNKTEEKATGYIKDLKSYIYSL